MGTTPKLPANRATRSAKIWQMAGTASGSSTKSRRIREGIERQMREDRIRGGHRVDPVQPNDLRSQRMCGKICIRDDDLIPVSELSKGAKKIGSEEGVDAAQHDRFPFKG